MKFRSHMVVAVPLLMSLSLVYGLNSVPIPDLPPVEDPGEPVSAAPKRTLKPFGSQEELKGYFEKLAERMKREQRAATATGNASVATTDQAASSAPKPAQESKEDDSITNNQHAGVDEGGIVKLHGDHLVILRRGRLFTVRVGDDSLRPVSAVDAYAPGVDPRGDWYDEMLTTTDTVAVIGYSYARGGTEINLFDIDPAGSLEYRSTYHLRSNDYYSSRNYASRLIGNKLVFYTPQYLGYYSDPTQRFPAIRRWGKGVTEEDFRPVVAPTRVYRAESLEGSSYNTALHTVTVCDLAAAEFSCEGTGVLGAPGRVFYVSAGSVYVWTTDWNYRNSRAKASSMLYRLPLDGSAPSALGVAGSPVDQFSFLESADQHLNVLVRSDGYGEQMWGSENAAGEVALFRTPISRFSDGSESAPFHRYRELPKPKGYTFQNRFVGDHVIYGTGSGWGRPESGASNEVFVVNWANGDTARLPLKHGVDRIENMGGDAVIVGANASDLYFTPVKLGANPDLRPSYLRRNAAQGELRSHGFFYKGSGRGSGLLGLPIANGGRPGYRHLVEGSASILFLKNDDLALKEAGELSSRDASPNDNCKASCVDWYGNARPIFIRDRVFALMGYELVEGRLTGEGISERRRTSFAPNRPSRNAGEE